MTVTQKQPLTLGQVVSTPGALSAFPMEFLTGCLQRHASRDWGDICEEDRAYNDADADGGGRILSSYNHESGQRLWVITEHDRSYTTLLLPEEY